MSRILQILLWLSVSGGVLTLLVMLINKVFRRTLPSRVMYYLWIPVLIRFLLPVASPVHMTFAPTISDADNTDAVYAETVVQKTDYEYENVQDYPTDDGRIYGEYKPVDEGYNAQSEADGEGEPIDFAEAQDDGAEKEKIQSGVGAPDILLLLTIVWATGAGISVIRNIISYSRFVYHLRRAKKEPTEEDRRLLRSMCKSRRLSLYRSEYVTTPMLVGIIRPMIILPDDTDADEVRYVLMHEVVHYRRHDLIIKWLTEFVISVHWFNPIMYLLRRQTARVCELSCDEAVAKSLDNTQRREYCSTLLSCAERKMSVSHFAATLCDEKENMKERLVNIMKTKKKTLWTIVLAIAVVVLLTGCAVALGLKGTEKATASDEVISAESEKVLSEREQSEQDANEYIAQVMQSDKKPANNSVSTPVPQNTPKPSHEPYEQKTVPFDARLVKTDKDEYTFEELSRGVLLEIDYDLLAEYGIEKYPEDNNEVRWWGQKGTVILKDAQADRVIYPIPNEPGVATITHMADENKGAVRLFAASEDAETVNVGVNFEQGRSYYHISFVKQGKKWVRTFAEPQEAYIREGYKALEYEYLHSEYNEVDDSWSVWTEKPSEKDRERPVIEGRSKIALSREEIADIALRELYNVFGNKFKKVVIAIGYVYDWADVAIYEPDKVKVRNGDCPFYTFEVNAYTGQIDDVTAWIHKDSIPTELYAKDVFPKNYNKMSPEEIALWFYEHTAYNANKAKIVKTRVVMSDRHSGFVDSVQLFMADGNSYEVGFNQMTDENVPMDIHGIYTGAPTH